MALETPSRPPPLHGKYHLKFPFWLLEHLPYFVYLGHRLQICWMGICSIRCDTFKSYCLFCWYDISCKLAEWVYSSFQMRRIAFGSDVPGIKGSFSNALSQTKANSIYMHCFHSKSYHNVAYVENFILKAITNTLICTVISLALTTLWSML